MSAELKTPATDCSYAPIGDATPKMSGDRHYGEVLRGAVKRGTLWTVGGYGSVQALRLLSNLIMTRMLFPEAFGLMAVVDSLLIGLRMVSDASVGPALIHRRQPPDAALLGTAWSVQIVRGLLIWTVVAVSAPALSHFYDEPILAAVLPAAGVQVLMEGFRSMGIFLAARNLKLRRLVLYELSALVSGISVMVAWAWLAPSVWALVAGGIVGSGVRMVLSHALFPCRGVAPSYRWECARELIKFGAWIFPSTVLAFVVLRSDRLLIANWLPLAHLGFYNVAVFFSIAAKEVAGQIADRVFFPFLARLDDGNPRQFRQEITRHRIRLFALIFPPLCVIAAFGDLLIFALYDVRYHEAGWMIRLLTGGAIVACANESVLPLLLAFGDPYRRFVALFWSAIAFVTSVVLGGTLGGETGLVLGVSVAPALSYPAVAWALRQHGIWTARVDMIAFACAGAGITLLLGLRQYFGGA